MVNYKADAPDLHRLPTVLHSADPGTHFRVISAGGDATDWGLFPTSAFEFDQVQGLSLPSPQ